MGRQLVRTVVLSRRGPESLPPAVREALDEVAEVRMERRDGSPAPAAAEALLAGAQVVASTNVTLPVFDEALLRRLPELRTIVVYATGYDALDVELLRRHGVELVVLPDYATTAVAEHALAMVLALATRLHLAHDRSRGAAPAGASLRGIELAGKTVGIVGVGRIGARVARLCHGVGMQPIGCDNDPVAERSAIDAGMVMGSLGSVLRRSDVAVLCADHRFGAPAIIGAGELAQLRPGAFLVNVARAALVDDEAVVAAIRGGRLRGYAVDDAVFGPEHDDLLTEGRILQTGHSAWWRDEVLERGAQHWGDAILAACRRLHADGRSRPSAAGVRHHVPRPGVRHPDASPVEVSA